MKKIRLTEDDLKRIVSSVIVEAKHVLDNDDYNDIYFRSLRNYVEDKLDVNLPKNLPMSYLHKKFGKEFLKTIGFDVESIRHKNFPSLGKYIYDNNLYEIPDLQYNEKFTDKFGRIINRIIEMLDLPDTVKIVLSEEEPYQVHFMVVIPDYNEFLKTPELNEDYVRLIYSNFLRLLERYIGVELGDPKLGQLSMGNWGVSIEDLDEWTKNVFNKKIKPFIKNSELGNVISRIKLDISGAEAKTNFSYRRTSRYSDRYDKIEKLIRDIKDTFGYNEKLFKITS
jgi:hypothetical protein